MGNEERIQTLAGALEDLAGRGFGAKLKVTSGRLHVLATGKAFRPEQVIIREHRRFEGVSDPDDMSVLYAIEMEDGTRGTLVDAYGVYSDPAVSAFMSEVPVPSRGPDGAAGDRPCGSSGSRGATAAPPASHRGG